MTKKVFFVLITFLISSYVLLAQTSYLQKKLDLECSIDSIFEFSIKKKIFPGGTIHVLHKGKSIIKKAYGYHTYNNKRKVKITDLYDLASITKVMGATFSIMKLYEQEKLKLDDSIGKYISGLNPKIGKATFREVLAHQAGFEAWIAYHKFLKDEKGNFKPNTLSHRLSDDFPIQISHNFFLHKNFYENVIKPMINDTQVDEVKKFRYSGLFFYFVPELVKKLSGCEYEDFLNMHFYYPLGTKTIVFNPLRFFSKDKIVPQELDNFFRNELIHGKVDDEGAILMNGVSGNAGLFGNVDDVAKVWQMLLNGGVYNNKRFLKTSTIDTFTTVQYPCNDNRRALGFDKPLLVYNEKKSALAKSVSKTSYGHTGFTGSIVWADPENELLFIFLCNRVHPTRKNKKIYKYNIRPKTHQIIYDYLGK